LRWNILLGHAVLQLPLSRRERGKPHQPHYKLS
jgi:hypothetical protein